MTQQAVLERNFDLRKSVYLTDSLLFLAADSAIKGMFPA